MLGTTAQCNNMKTSIKLLKIIAIIGPRREKTVFGVSVKREIQTSLLSYRDNLEN